MPSLEVAGHGDLLAPDLGKGVARRVVVEIRRPGALQIVRLVLVRHPLAVGDGGPVLNEGLQVPVTHSIAPSLPTLRSSFGRALADHKAAEFRQRNRTPVLHLMAHGSEKGFALTHRRIVPWSTLVGLVSSFATQARPPLVSLSVCYGVNLETILGRPTAKYAVGTVGSQATPLFSESIIGFSTLYHRIQAGDSLEKGVQAMKTASGHKEFCFVSPVDRGKWWESMLKTALESDVPVPEGMAEQIAEIG